jgi:hypothetical protein
MTKDQYNTNTAKIQDAKKNQPNQQQIRQKRGQLTKFEFINKINDIKKEKEPQKTHAPS